MKYCITCGTVLSDETEYCAHCGSPQSVAKQSEQGQVQSPPIGQPQIYSPAQAPTPSAWFQCRNCNSMIPVFPAVPCHQCPVCGCSLTSDSNTQSRWTAGHIISIISILAVFIGEFLPFLTISILGFSDSVQVWSSKFAGTAFLTTFLLGCCLLLVAFNKKSKGKLSFVSALIILVLIYGNYSGNQARLTDVDAGWGIGKIDASGMLQPGFGLYLMVVGCLGMIAGTIALHMRRKV